MGMEMGKGKGKTSGVRKDWLMKDTRCLGQDEGRIKPMKIKCSLDITKVENQTRLVSRHIRLAAADNETTAEHWNDC